MLRTKKRASVQVVQSAAQVVQPAPVESPPTTPLFARFATSVVPIEPGQKEELGRRAVAAKPIQLDKPQFDKPLPPTREDPPVEVILSQNRRNSAVPVASSRPTASYQRPTTSPPSSSNNGLSSRLSLFRKSSKQDLQQKDPEKMQVLRSAPPLISRQPSAGPIRSKPLIFSATTAGDVSAFSPPAQSYPSPPAENRRVSKPPPVVQERRISKVPSVAQSLRSPEPLEKRLPAVDPSLRSPERRASKQPDQHLSKAPSNAELHHHSSHRRLSKAPSNVDYSMRSPEFVHARLPPAEPPIPPKHKKSSRSISSSQTGHRTLTKQRPTTPVSPSPTKKPLPPVTDQVSDLDLSADVGVPLDDDPFAKPEVTIKPSPSGENLVLKSEHSDSQVKGSSVRQGASIVKAPPSSVTPEDYRNARSRRRGEGLEPPPAEIGNLSVREDRPAEPFPLHLFVSDANLLATLLAYLSFHEWCILSSVSKRIRSTLVVAEHLKEAALERYLKTVGYSRWRWDDPDPLPLSLLDLHQYMRGVSIPTHEYSRVAEAYIPLMDAHPSRRDPDGDVSNLTAAARAFTRVVLRLRVQAEKESAVASSATSQRSAASYSQSQVHLAARPTAFKSPLYHMRRAPLLRVFVPSPDGDWLSDTSVLECEAELKRAGVQHLLRMGDVVWDIALGDEGNVGRLVWDGSFLIDLDYTYSAVGDLPNKYLPNLAFPPSYFHRVIRTGPNSGNPIVRFDLRPWTDDILSNLQLLQDRVRTETPQGHYHNVVRWVHRSSFVIRPNNVLPTSRKHTHQARIPIPNSNLFVDPGWYGTVIIETEGTNEALAELRQALTAPKDLLVFRIVRERSRPGEIMIKRETSRS